VLLFVFLGFFCVGVKKSGGFELRIGAIRRGLLFWFWGGELIREGSRGFLVVRRGLYTKVGLCFFIMSEVFLFACLFWGFLNLGLVGDG